MTNTEKGLFAWVYSLQVELAKKLLAERNKEHLDAGDLRAWPAQQKWEDLSGSSKAIFLKNARDASGISHDAYKVILRSEEGMDIAEKFASV